MEQKEARKDAIINRLAGIDQALENINYAADNLRRERTKLWAEYRGLIAEELEIGKKPEEVTAAGD